MNKKYLLVAFVGCLAFSGPLSRLRGQTADTGIDQQLRSPYRTALVNDTGAVIRPGSVLVVVKDGIKANPPSGIIYWYNSHKAGDRIKYSVVFESMSGDLKSQVRPLQVGEKVLLTRLEVKPKSSAVEFYVQTHVSSPDDTPYRASVVFQFPKGFIVPANLKAIQDSIGEVFTVDTSSTAERAALSSSEGRHAKPEQGAQPTPLSGLYFMQKTGAHLQLDPDGSFSLHAASGHVSPGHFAVNGDTLVLTYTATGRSANFTIQGDKFYASTGAAWVRQGDSPTMVSQPPMPPKPVLNLPSTYLNTQAQADQLRLNADHSFTLQEAGQKYHGTFAVNGDTLEIIISDGPKTTMTIHGSNLTDTSKQTWALQDQSTGPGPATSGGPGLRNEDIIKLAKVGIDDATIVAKIGSSKCQFDTSPDALIQLKQSGVSAAVLKAMVGAVK